MGGLPRRGDVSRIVIRVCALLAALSVPLHAAQEKKVAVPHAELPPAIRAAIEAAFPAAEIQQIEKEVEGEDPGQYDVELRSGGKEYEVEISPEGKIIETKEKATAGEEPATEATAGEGGKRWTSSFHREACSFATTGRNRFFILEPGYRLVLENRTEKVTITVLAATKKIGEVETRVVEEREEKGGKLVEVSRNFFALCREHGDLFYFGEEVDDYKDGRIVGHGGAWRADEKDSREGILMPGTVLLGARFYQEISPKAMDRAEILRDDVTLKTPAGTFKDCLRVEETSGLDPDEKCYKVYAPGVGLIQDEDLLLTCYGMAQDEKSPR
jgi:hypothetical protein